ncbi:hypothetical protein [Breznakia pachnodae]|uniref:HTH cro/C1-type domain-containing protein n=1 Tax=Breznakia pachnodae TaxID=265178 RepID=A0ABU0DY05_9FIRM|nr:hypothetical protein [Breznakia pachnodae]MDQ0359512.1 hypothetical protein [Breznakia pachnodae]
MKKKKTEELEKILKHASHHELKEFIDQMEHTNFVEYFEFLLNQYSMKKGEVINNTNIDRTYAYQILQGKKQGSKDKIFQLALGMNCTLYECNTLLQLSDKSRLYPKKKRDMILIYALESKLSVFETNELLNEFQEDILQ